MSPFHSPEFLASWFQRNYFFYESMGANDLGIANWTKGAGFT